jgi:hypothetical protein
MHEEHAASGAVPLHMVASQTEVHWPPPHAHVPKTLSAGASAPPLAWLQQSKHASGACPAHWAVEAGVVGVVAGADAGAPPAVEGSGSDGAVSLFAVGFLVVLGVFLLAVAAPLPSSARLPSSGIVGDAQAATTRDSASASPRRLFAFSRVSREMPGDDLDPSVGVAPRGEGDPVSECARRKSYIVSR